MKTFLEYVAQDIISKNGNNLARIAVVFPNKRASLFFSEHLARQSDKPVWCPSYITISDLFRKHSDLQIADPIELVCILYRCFVECTGSAETLDHFYGWGQLLLSDIDDIDKNMADAKKVFANLRDLHELDDISYLTPEQVETIKKFFSNFTDTHNSELRKRFLSLWSHFYDIYDMFNSTLAERGLAYEGALYRKVACDDNISFEYDKYVFVGFNVLQRVEQKLFKRLKEGGKAAFYWDFDDYYMAKGKHIPSEAGHYISSYLSDFPNELPIDNANIYRNFKKKKSITFISATTENIQARYIGTWLRENKRIEDGRQTAIVMCNEQLLPSAIHSLPPEVDNVNITTGYPLALTPVSSLVALLLALQTNGYVASSRKFRLQFVNSVLKHPYISYISSNYSKLLKQLNDITKVYYPSNDELCIDSGTQLLFSNISAPTASEFIERLSHWAKHVVELVAINAGSNSDALMLESLFRMYTLLSRLNELISTGVLEVDIATFQRLLVQLVQSTSIPFHGEPAVGIQLMGVLETRNIDFKHVLMLSCNEGNMPKGVNDTSFIPYNIRKAYGLTTIDNKVAIYAYYFHRLLQRADDITLVYNKSTDEGKKGEMSRFMLQMMVESGHKIQFKTLQGGLTVGKELIKAIEKNAAIAEHLASRFDIEHNDKTDAPLLTPTAINTYMRCQLMFYYNYVLRLHELEDTDEDGIDNRIFGNIFHTASQKMYELLLMKGKKIEKHDLERLLKSGVELERIVDETFAEELFKLKKGEKHCLTYNGLQIINREVIITYLRKLIMIDIRLTPFYIIGLEKDVAETYEIKMGKTVFRTSIGGRVDRLDMIDSDCGRRIRVIDYKTGSRQPLPLSGLEDVFDDNCITKHSDYYLQTFLYSKIISDSEKVNPGRLAVSPGLLFIQQSSVDNYDPTLCFGKKPVTDIAEYKEEFFRMLKDKIQEIFNLDMAFTPTANKDICKYCPYTKLCGM